MSEIFVILSLLFVTGIGYIWITGLNLLSKKSVFDLLPYSYGLGIGLIAFQLYIYSRIEVPWELGYILIPWIGFFIGLIIFKRKTLIWKPIFMPAIQFGSFDKILLFLIVTLLLFVGFEALLRPLSAWDGWTIWLFRAKAFYLDGFVSTDILRQIQLEYPLVISLASTFLYIVLGGVNDRVVLLMFFVFYLSLSMAFFTSTKSFLGTRKALFFTFLLISLQNLVRHGGRYEAGQADLALGFYFFTSCMLLFEYIKNKSFKTAILFNIFLGFTGLIKNEGIPFSFILELILLYHMIKFKRLKDALASLIWLFLLLDWQMFKYANNLPWATPFISSVIKLSRLPVVLLEISKEFLNIKNWNLLWITFFTVFFKYIFELRKNWLTIIYVVIFFQLGVYVFIFLITNTDPVAHIRSVVNRLFIHISPLAMFASAIVIFGKKISKT